MGDKKKKHIEKNMKIFQFFAAAAFSQELDNANWSCDFAYDFNDLSAPPSEYARFISITLTDVSESAINMHMTTEVMAQVCEGSIATLRSEGAVPILQNGSGASSRKTANTVFVTVASQHFTKTPSTSFTESSTLET